MTAKIKLLLIATLILGMAACGDDKTGEKDGKKSEVNSSYNAKVIYGDDDRADLYQITDKMLLQLASSTVALVDSNNMTENIDGSFKIKTENFGASYNLCPSEPYRNQNTAAFCSGFLVGPKTVVSAGHCMRFASDCTDTKFVFNFAIKSGGATTPNTATKNDVYSCAKIIKSEVISTGADYSVIELDREVEGHLPLAIRTSDSPKVNDPLIVVGHPSGLPTKIAGGAGVRKVNAGYLVANLDTYGGNSGSAVFNANTGEVEGVLVRGETDFVMQGSCRVSNRCPNTGCRGEDVTLIKEPAKFFTPVKAPPQSSDAKAYSVEPNLVIPDYSIMGVSSAIDADEAPDGRGVQVKVNLLHSWRGDLVIDLIAPTGDVVRLLNRTGGKQSNVRGTFGSDLKAGQLAPMSLIKSTGKWNLKIYDRARRDIGILQSWSLIFN